MSTSLLSMNNQIAAAAAAGGGVVGPGGGGAGAGGWCSGSVPTKTSTSTTQLIIKPSMSNAINFSSIPFRGNNSHSNNNNNRLSLGAGILMPISSNIANHHSTSANAMSMSLPQSTTIISIPQLSCSLSLPILCPKYGNNNHYYFKNNTELSKGIICWRYQQICVGTKVRLFCKPLIVLLPHFVIQISRSACQF